MHQEANVVATTNDTAITDLDDKAKAMLGNENANVMQKAVIEMQILGK